MSHSVSPLRSDDGESDAEYYSEEFNQNHQSYKKIHPSQDTRYLDVSAFSLMTKQASGLLLSNKGKTLTDKNIVRILSNRTGGWYSSNHFSPGLKCNISNNYLPRDVSTIYVFSDKVFCGMFSKDGDRFLTASRDRSIRIYDSSTGTYKFMHSIIARDVGWSIIDVVFSPDRKHFVYSTWSYALHLCNTDDNINHQEPLHLLKSSRRFCIFSVKFSSDGRELLGGANDGCLYIYDLHRQQKVSKIHGHVYDVNSVCFADDSSQIIYSGGDDGLIKVWDRRTLYENTPKPVGVLAGHADGITYIDSRGDGRHFISNSKDQSIKLWDVRIFSGSNAAENSLKAAKTQPWDYRWHQVPLNLLSSPKSIDGDTSIMTYRGHVVVKTLLRCRFSPSETTGQRYIYTGCGIGRVIIYDSLTGQIVESLKEHQSCVRDVDWHPKRSEIISSSWDSKVKKYCYKGEDFENELNQYGRKSLRLALKKRRLIQNL